MGTTFLLPKEPAHHAGSAPDGVADAPAAPGGRRVRVLDWGSYVVYFRRPLLGSLLLEFFCFTFAFAMFTSGAALFAERRFTWHGVPFGPKEVGYIFMYSGFLGMIVQGALRQGALVRRLGEPALVLGGFVAAAVGYALLGFSHGIALLLISISAAALGTGLLRPALTSLITQQVDRTEQGVVLGLTQSLMSVSQIAGPALAGALIDRQLLEGWALVAAAVTLGGIASSARSMQRRAQGHLQQPG
jgi:predicted MFS family arabinose efflux permease